jgi:hypothetical protein
MRRNNQYVASLFLSAALLAPIGANAMVTPQDDRDHERHEQEEHQRKVYDEERHEYRAWDRQEDEAYRHWMEFKHHAYVDYDRLDNKMKREYWKWRHEHEEHEEHEHDHQ